MYLPALPDNMDVFWHIQDQLRRLFCSITCKIFNKRLFQALKISAEIFSEKIDEVPCKCKNYRRNAYLSLLFRGSIKADKAPGSGSADEYCK